MVVPARFYLLGQRQTDSFQELFVLVDVVAQQKVVGLGQEATILEQPQQVELLTMYATHERRNQGTLPPNS